MSSSSTQELITNEEMPKDYASLVASQREYFNSGRPALIAHRIEQLRKLRELIVTEGKAICEGVYKDLGRKPELTQIYEISGVINEIDSMIRNVKDWAAPVTVPRTMTTLLDTPKIYKEPKGVVLVIGPWNYPIWTVLGPLANIIAAGNTVVIKPSEISSHTAEVFDCIFTMAFPKNYLAVVQGGVNETSELLKQQFDHIVYTGNTTVGHIVMEAASKHLATVTLELGGKCPAVVLADVDVEVTARRLVWGKLMNCGQTCIAPDYVMVASALKKRFLEAMLTTMHQFYGEDVQHNADYSRIISARHFNRLLSILEKSTAQVLYKGGTPDASDLFMPPIFLDATFDDSSMKEELFGPILPIVTVQNLDEAIEHINKGDCPLAAYLFTRSEDSVEKFLERTRSGGVCINDVVLHVATEGFHFGGFGKSGMGRYHGKAGFDEFTHEKPVLKRGFFADGLAAGRYPPVTKQKLAQLARITSTRPLVPPFVWKLVNGLPFFLLGAAFYYLSERYLFAQKYSSHRH